MIKGREKGFNLEFVRQRMKNPQCTLYIYDSITLGIITSVSLLKGYACLHTVFPLKIFFNSIKQRPKATT